MEGYNDQLNLPTLASMEMIARRICNTVDAFRPDWKGVKYIVQTLSQRAFVASALRAHARRLLKEEAEFENLRQKLRGTEGGAKSAFRNRRGGWQNETYNTQSRRRAEGRPLGS